MSEVTIEPTPLVWKGHYSEVEDEYDEVVGRQVLRVGWAFFVEPGGYGAPAAELRFGLDRLPIVVMCPAFDRTVSVAATGEVRRTVLGTPFCVDAASSRRPPEWWDVDVVVESLVVGAQPDITVHPSIHLIGLWHGWLQHGVLHQ